STGPLMRCPACGFENASGIGECGAPLKLKCGSCGFENAPGIKFCGECGQHLADSPSRAALPKPRTYTPKHLAERILAEQAAMEARSAADGERKTITALFADIKGSVELMEWARPRGGARDRRSGTPGHDGRCPSLRGLRGAVAWGRNLRSL